MVIDRMPVPGPTRTCFDVSGPDADVAVTAASPALFGFSNDVFTVSPRIDRRRLVDQHLAVKSDLSGDLARRRILISDSDTDGLVRPAEPKTSGRRDTDTAGETEELSSLHISPLGAASK